MSDAKEKNNRKPAVRRALGLAYKPDHGVPQVILKAAGRSAEDVIWSAQKNARPSIVRDSKLLDSLYRLPTDSDIPPELFELVAILLVHVAAADAEISATTAAAKLGV